MAKDLKVAHTNGHEENKGKKKKTAHLGHTDPLAKIQLRERIHLPGSLAEVDDDLSKQKKRKSASNESVKRARQSAYSKKRLANETREERMLRLSKMTKNAYKRLAKESPEERAIRLAKMAEYTSRRLAEEDEHQKLIRLKKMREYASKHYRKTKRRRGKRTGRVSKNHQPEMVLIAS